MPPQQGVRSYLLAGGGTGGHLFPGVAVAEELAARDPQARLVFVGSDRVLEKTLFHGRNWEHHPLPVESLGTLKRNPIAFGIRNLRAFAAAWRLIREIKPSAVVGLGGYASAPVVWAAARHRIPILLLEQNRIAGRTNRWLSRWACEVCVSFPETTGLSPRSDVVVTGNPVRQEIRSLSVGISPSTQRDILILGGSQGADRLNELVVAASPMVRPELAGWRIVHQTGPRQVDRVRDAYRRLGIEAVVEPFFQQMSSCYGSAGLVISRAGATTLAELTCCGLPMILVPYPAAADDHQRANAAWMRDYGAAEIVEQETEASVSELSRAWMRLLTDTEHRQALANASRTLGRPEAAATIAERILRRVIPGAAAIEIQERLTGRSLQQRQSFQ